MNDWRELNIKGITKIEKIVAEFQIWSLAKVPYGKFRIKIIEKNNGDFIGIPNLMLKNHNDNSIDGISGLGSSIEEALEDSIKRFMELIYEYEKIYRRELIETDFEWSAHEDF